MTFGGCPVALVENDVLRLVSTGNVLELDVLLIYAWLTVKSLLPP